MSDLEIFIPSRSRPERSMTLEALEAGGVADRATLVVPYKQGRDYLALGRRHKIHKILMCRDNGIAKTRQFIGERAQGKFLMLDDDLRFYRRKSVDDWRLHKFRDASNRRSDMLVMLDYISTLLNKFAHVSISPRQMNQKYATFCTDKIKPEPEKYPFYACGRPIRVLAYRKGPFMQCEHGRVDIMEDFDVTMQLLRMGYQNAVITRYAQDQVVTQMPGGCSDYRTHELHAKSVRKMAKLHEGFISIKEKHNKSKQAIQANFAVRLEAMILWQKAWRISMEDIL